MSVMGREANVESIIAQHFNGRPAVNAEHEGVQSRDRKFIEAVGRGIAILEAFERASGTLGNGELHQFTGFSKPAITRLTHTLMMLGYLRRTDNGRFELSPRVGVLARPFYDTAGTKLPNDALNDLASTGPWCITVAEPEASALIVTTVYRGHLAGTPQCVPGTRLDLASTSAGRAWAATLTTEPRRRSLASAVSTALPPEVVAKARAELAQKGFCFEAGLWKRGVATIAMPIPGDSPARLRVLMCAVPEKPAMVERLAKEAAPKLRGLWS